MELALHPMVIHFPIALSFLWPMVDAIGLALGRPDVSKVGAGLLALAVPAALVATVTGQAAYEAALARGYAVEVLDQHADWAALIPWALLVVLAVRTLGVRRAGTKAHLLAIILGALVSGLVAVSGYEGGQLSHGIGVGFGRASVSSKG